MGDLDPTEKALLGRVIDACYRLAGITVDPATHDRTPPELLDLLAALDEAGADQVGPRSSSRGPWGDARDLLGPERRCGRPKPPVFEHAFAHQREHFVNTGRPQGLDVIPGQVKYGL